MQIEEFASTEYGHRELTGDIGECTRFLFPISFPMDGARYRKCFKSALWAACMRIADSAILRKTMIVIKVIESTDRRASSVLYG